MDLRLTDRGKRIVERDVSASLNGVETATVVRVMLRVPRYTVERRCSATRPFIPKFLAGVSI
jgi:hypothetical protein